MIFLGGTAGNVTILVYSLFLSGSPCLALLGGLAAFVAAYFVTRRLLVLSIASGAMGMLFLVLAPPFVCMAFVLAAVAGSRLADGPRRAIMAAGIVLAFGGWTLVKTGGFD